MLKLVCLPGCMYALAEMIYLFFFPQHFSHMRFDKESYVIFLHIIQFYEVLYCNPVWFDVGYLYSNGLSLLCLCQSALISLRQQIFPGILNLLDYNRQECWIFHLEISGRTCSVSFRWQFVLCEDLCVFQESVDAFILLLAEVERCLCDAELWVICQIWLLASSVCSFLQLCVSDTRFI